jgi:hypothetical protein
MKLALSILLILSSQLIYAQDDIQALESAVRTTKRTVGEKHLDYANALIDLAEGYQESKEWDLAKAQLLEAIQIINLPREGTTRSAIDKTKITYYFIEWKGAFEKSGIAPNKILPYDWYKDCVKYGEEDKIENIVEMVYSKASFHSTESYQYWKMAKRALDDTARTHVAQTNRMYRLLLRKATAEFGVESNAAIGVLYGQMKYNERRGDSLLVEQLKAQVRAQWGAVFESDSSLVFSIVEEMPRFPGCEYFGSDSQDKHTCSIQKLLDFVYEEIDYPSFGKKCGVEGMSVVQFRVAEYGYLCNIRVLRDPGGGLGMESRRVISMMNEMPFRWGAGKKEGEIVSVKYNMPIRFKLH